MSTFITQRHLSLAIRFVTLHLSVLQQGYTLEDLDLRDAPMLSNYTYVLFRLDGDTLVNGIRTLEATMDRTGWRVLTSTEAFNILSVQLTKAKEDMKAVLSLASKSTSLLLVGLTPEIAEEEEWDLFVRENGLGDL